MPIATPERTHRSIPVLDLDGTELERLSAQMKLSLSRADMEAVRGYFESEGRDPTDVELEVIAQTWSEHCKHRIFGARIRHEHPGGVMEIDGLFRSCIRATTERVRARKPGFVVAAFDDNAGFIRLDERLAVCLKVETHNHPSAIEPYAGANTGLGGVIRDILGAGKGAKPVGSLDVFCFGSPDTPSGAIRAPGVIHPVGILRGVVRGVRDYGNRMGIPTVTGAVQFDSAYIYNPLVFCGTAGVLPAADIPKRVSAGQILLAIGGRTGRDGLRGATFSSASLNTGSHEEDQQAVQIGNPIEEKKVLDLVLEARERGLIAFITDCGAGGFSSAAGEMLSETGGEIYLERAPLKEEGLVSWEIFLSESQERMVLAVEPKHVGALKELAEIFETECTVLGEADGSGRLKVRHHGELVCELDCRRLHEAPQRNLVSRWRAPDWSERTAGLEPEDWNGVLREVMADFAVVSREPIIREYDHEVQGNTVLKPLAGATGDAPQDGAVLEIDGSNRLIGLAVSLLPEWGKTDPRAMGRACVDECVRQLVCLGADPEQIALLDNFCMGNPDDPEQLGSLVESVRGICEAAEAYGAPFISGKDSFYNYFETEDGPVAIPATVLISGMGVLEDAAHVTGASLRPADGSVLYLLGRGQDRLGGSVYARRRGQAALWRRPETFLEENREIYRRYHQALRNGWILAAHDVSEGGLIVALAEMGFSMAGGLELEKSLGSNDAAAELFGEGPGRIVVQARDEDAGAMEKCFAELACRRVGRVTAAHRLLRAPGAGIEESLDTLKDLWRNGLKPYY
ncbi:MAG TPA: phosphoribosylformylglycinamidine synthase subunit PurL [Verrucomicrobiales bacterium]|nr:phosphoribosylformylglycinamidine synthase subunit PurL [Verrucomicrobiales bacterium]